MPTPKKASALGGSPSHQRKILANMATQLIENAWITTTLPKAKALQPYFEKLVTKAKRGDIHARRIVARKITDRDAVYELFDVIVPKIDPERNGGYTRITKVGNRRGDNAPMAVIEIITDPLEKDALLKAAQAPAKMDASHSNDLDDKVEDKEDDSSEDTTEISTAETDEVETDTAETNAAETGEEV